MDYQNNNNQEIIVKEENREFNDSTSENATHKKKKKYFWLAIVGLIIFAICLGAFAFFSFSKISSQKHSNSSNEIPSLVNTEKPLTSVEKNSLAVKTTTTDLSEQSDSVQIYKKPLMAKEIKSIETSNLQMASLVFYHGVGPDLEMKIDGYWYKGKRIYDYELAGYAMEFGNIYPKYYFKNSFSEKAPVSVKIRSDWKPWHENGQVIKIKTEDRELNVFLPRVVNPTGESLFYIAEDGSTYFGKEDHYQYHNKYVMDINLSWQEAIQPEHLARASDENYQFQAASTIESGAVTKDNGEFLLEPGDLYTFKDEKIKLQFKNVHAGAFLGRTGEYKLDNVTADENGLPYVNIADEWAEVFNEIEVYSEGSVFKFNNDECIARTETDCGALDCHSYKVLDKCYIKFSSTLSTPNQITPLEIKDTYLLEGSYGSDNYTKGSNFESSSKYKDNNGQPIDNNGYFLGVRSVRVEDSFDIITNFGVANIDPGHYPKDVTKEYSVNIGPQQIIYRYLDDDNLEIRTINFDNSSQLPLIVSYN